MPNPFPGMDPYLEGDLWMSVHTDLCAEIARQLAPKVRPKYVVLSTRREILVPPIPQISVEIRDVAKRRLVTCIEVLSRTNKVGPGRDEYLAKRFQTFCQHAHMLDIDLLRAEPESKISTKPLPVVSYLACLSRTPKHKNEDVWSNEVWPIALEAPLPKVSVPLLWPDADVTLDLQAALTTIYDILGYDESIDYSLPPPGPMSDAQLEWVRERLIQTGRRVVIAA